MAPKTRSTMAAESANAEFNAAWSRFMKNSEVHYTKAVSIINNYSTVEEWAYACGKGISTAYTEPSNGPDRKVVIPVKNAADVLISIHMEKQKSVNTSAEAPKEPTGKELLNKILFKEYNTWWDAFVEEAKEDADPLTAEQRFAIHAAKIIYRKVGREIPREEIEPVVEAWLMEHAAQTQKI